MVTAASAPVCPSSLVISPLSQKPGKFCNVGSSLARLPLKGFSSIRASSKEQQPSSSKGNNPLASVLSIPGTIWSRILNPLSDFGFGRRSVWEGGVGLFIASGTVLLALTLVWLKGFHMRSQFKKYRVVFEFAQACGISLGTPVRIRGVTVGTVVRVHSSLKSVDAVVEVEDEKVIIPRNSLVEVNQSGLLMETMIDITPRDPLPVPSVGPLDEGCFKEGLIVCDRETIRGKQGVSLDELVGIFSRLGREMEEIGVARSYALAEKVVAIAIEAQPLIAKVEAMLEEVHPMLSQVRQSELLKDVQSLTRTLADATQDLRTARSSMITSENGDLLKESISTLVATLKNIEGITSDISLFTGDETTRKNIKLLVKSLSRLM
ncbi:trigalactosyldiacylglycerol2 [Wolffia australiana]